MVESRYRYCLSMLLLPEDSAGRGPDVLVNICTKALQVVDQHTRTNLLEFEPLLRKSQEWLSVTNQRWRGSGDDLESHRVRLVRRIATKLLEPNGFVLFHHDGDQPWANRMACAANADFDKFIVARVRNLVRSALQNRAPLKRVEDEVNSAMAKLIKMVPFYSIEAWLFQNLTVAFGLDTQYENANQTVLKKWSANRSAIDEELQPKEMVTWRDKHNLELACRAFPADVVYEIGKSFFAFVESLSECEQLCVALRSTWDQSEPSSQGASDANPRDK